VWFSVSGGTILVLQKGASSLAYYSPDSKLLATVPVGQHPHEMVCSADGKYLYTSDNGTMRIENEGTGGNSLSVVDIAARRKAADIPLGNFRRPHGLDIDHKSGHLVVTTEAPDQLVLVDTASRGVIRTYDTKGKTSHMVTFGPNAGWAYVSNAGSGNVSAINLKTAQVKLIPTGTRPEGSVLSKDGRELYVCNRESNYISVIDTAKNMQVAIIKTGKGPVRIAITPDGKQLVYALMHQNAIGIADPHTRQQLDYILLPASPISVSIAADGKHAIASAEEAGSVYIVSLQDKRISGEIKTPPGAAPDPAIEIP
jgi:YVTN family beta-propeller protein